MAMVARYTTPIAADSEIELEAGRRYCMITFDDGLLTYKDCALPEMEKYAIPSTNFIPTGYLGGACTWMRPELIPLSPRDRIQYEQDRVMTEEELKSLPENRVTLGAHGVRHIHLTAVSEQEAMQELRESKSRLESILGRPVTLFSFPRGEYHDGILEQVRQAGYRRVFSIAAYPALRTPSEFLCGRCCAEPTDWDIEFYLKLLNAYRWQPAVTKIKRRIKALLKSPERKKTRDH
jgi:peptidoglycan/xylan/chitin deacetylase (PgdA/CDA1 family)